MAKTRILIRQLENLPPVPIIVSDVENARKCRDDHVAKFCEFRAARWHYWEVEDLGGKEATASDFVDISFS
jgi:hypothetical protein